MIQGSWGATALVAHPGWWWATIISAEHTSSQYGQRNLLKHMANRSE